MSKKSVKGKKTSKKSDIKAIHLDKKTIIYIISALCLGVLLITRRAFLLLLFNDTKRLVKRKLKNGDNK